MNMPGAEEQISKCVSTVLVDDSPEESKAQQNGAQDDDVDSEATDLAKLLGEKICKKTGLRQLFFSLSID